jgi:hypothetical protein
MGKSRPADPSQNVCLDGGTQRYNDDAVEVRTGVAGATESSPVSSVAQCSIPQPAAGADDGISIQIKCSQNPHLVQFVYREVIDASGNPVSTTVTTTAGARYRTTTDPDHLNWNTDSAVPPNPYYESGGIYRRDPNALTTLDQPGLRPGPGETWRATFKAYAICNGRVVREITWVREQTGNAPPTYSSVTVQPANQLPPWAVQQLQNQGYNAVP